MVRRSNLRQKSANRFRAKSYGRKAYRGKPLKMAYKYKKYRKSSRKTFGKAARGFGKQMGRLRIKNSKRQSYRRLTKAIIKPVLKQRDLKRNPVSEPESICYLDNSSVFAINNSQTVTSRDLSEVENIRLPVAVQPIAQNIAALFPPPPFTTLFTSKLSTSISDSKLYLKKTTIQLDNVLQTEPAVLFEFKYPFFVNHQVYTELVSDVFQNLTFYNMIIENLVIWDLGAKTFIKAKGWANLDAFMAILYKDDNLRTIAARQILSMLSGEYPTDILVFNKSGIVFTTVLNTAVSIALSGIGSALGYLPPNAGFGTAFVSSIPKSQYDNVKKDFEPRVTKIITDALGWAPTVDFEKFKNLADITANTFKYFDTFMFNCSFDQKINFIKMILSAGLRAVKHKKTVCLNQYLTAFLKNETDEDYPDSNYLPLRSLIATHVVKTEVLKQGQRFVYYPSTYGSVLILLSTVSTGINVKLTQKYVIGFKQFVKWLVRIKDKNKLSLLSTEFIKFMVQHAPYAMPIDYDRLIYKDKTIS